ncbi:MAG: exodeoxyribonuclease VII large subunit [FCB group bacterium]|nr:exodeoxyribonuclease VII large subunit [FCB group bacterium]
MSAAVKNNIPLLSVSEITGRIKSLLEGTFPEVRISGEISNFTHHSSGHMYFTLKDNRAELRAVMFRGNNQFLRFTPENGMQVLADGRISVYEQRGQYQLIVQGMVPAGIGALYLAFEALKKKLAAEGLFEQRWKKPLPPYPSRVGVITSPTGAAIQDILQILGRRAPHVEVILRPTLVQGEGAADDLVQALEEFATYGKVDVLIIGRGGGSLEDLWPFNEEKVARAIHACPLPVIAAVGHETDFSIADMVADLRAPTPSAAAELVAPARSDLVAKLDQQVLTMTRILRHRLEQIWQDLDHLTSRYAFQQPEKRIKRHMEYLDQLNHQLIQSFGYFVKIRTSHLSGLWKKLEALNPQDILARGYSIAYTLPERRVIRSARALEVGAPFELQTADGRLRANKTDDL